MAKLERLDKVLSNNGYGTRKDVKRLLHSKVVFVNGEVCTSADAHVSLTDDDIEVDGEKLFVRQNAYIMLNKPSGVVSSTKDGIHQTVIDILCDDLTDGYKSGELFPIGRLDIDTEGLLLITNDGDLTHKLTSPKNAIDKTYFVRLRDAVSDDEKLSYKKKLSEGIHIKEEKNELAHDCLPAKVQFLKDNECCLTIQEGKFHQVKRMFAALENEVIYLKRISVAGLKLDENLPTGQARSLTEDEKRSLFDLFKS